MPVDLTWLEENNGDGAIRVWAEREMAVGPVKEVERLRDVSKAQGCAFVALPAEHWCADGKAVSFLRLAGTVCW
jgi:hypothetical protein